MTEKTIKMIVQLILFYWMGRQPSDDIGAYIDRWVKENQIDVTLDKYKQNRSFMRLIDKKYFQVWINPSWNVIIMIEIYNGLTIRFGRLLIHLFGRRWND